MNDQLDAPAAPAPDAAPAVSTPGGVPSAAGPAGELRVALPDTAGLRTIGEARAAIDGIDAVLAALLERRVAVAGVVQRLKPVGGFAGRDAARERAIVEAMAAHAPSLGAERLARIMTAVIEAGLDAADESARA
ncbi:chorismate mutase [Actinomadura algeriensis]|uniref:Chorismate mutase n=1 Tax=Actinomadura algeriensis TaxID=1679523 RepID=A0ABR9JXJ9_9ACTN|nr:chorismate mutase [Actinomadura algeriensis]MBE1535307.1 chorismate mutase [Actinomadura algeriensis]